MDICLLYTSALWQCGKHCRREYIEAAKQQAEGKYGKALQGNPIYTGILVGKQSDKRSLKQNGCDKDGKGADYHNSDAFTSVSYTHLMGKVQILWSYYQ